MTKLILKSLILTLLTTHVTFADSEYTTEVNFQIWYDTKENKEVIFYIPEEGTEEERMPAFDTVVFLPGELNA